MSASTLKVTFSRDTVYCGYDIRYLRSNSMKREYKIGQVYLCEVDKLIIWSRKRCLEMVEITEIFNEKLKIDYKDLILYENWVTIKEFESKFKPEYYGYYKRKPYTINERILVKDIV